ncbi:MAG: DUF2125 domain-containing protein, partial [Pseudorhodobacter sp.]|nr:DUF2125 domain-containing protein [Pseudorhodobacter sp.]
LPIHLTLPKDTAEGQPSEVDLTIAAPDATLTASGVPTSINYDNKLPKLQVTAKGSSLAEQMNLTLKMTEVAAKYLAEAGETGQNLSGDFSSKTFDLAATGKDNAGQDTDVKLSLAGLGGKVNLTGLPADSKVPFETALAAGFTFDGGVTYGIGSVDISGTEASKPMKVAGTLGGGGLNVSMDASKFHYDATNRSLSLNASGTDAASGGDFTFAAAMADFSSAVDIKGSGWTNTDDFDAALKSGMIMAVSGGLGSTNVDFAGGPVDKPVKFKGALASMKTSFTLSAAQISSDFGAKALAVTVASPEIPLPEVSLNLGELAFGLVMPAAKSDKPAPFTYMTKIIDLQLPETLWAMIDPAATLAHDAATIIIDTSGTAMLTRDLMADAQALEGGSSEPPGVLNTLKIPQILAKALGAEVTANGAFTFDATDMVTIPGMPLPTGKIDINATGINALIDKLVTMGLLPQDQAMQGRMVLSMFANSSATADEITSTLEFKDKHFYANGQQLQ